MQNPPHQFRFTGSPKKRCTPSHEALGLTCACLNWHITWACNTILIDECNVSPPSLNLRGGKFLRGILQIKKKLFYLQSCRMFPPSNSSPAYPALNIVGYFALHEKCTQLTVPVFAGWLIYNSSTKSLVKAFTAGRRISSEKKGRLSQ